MGSFAAYKITKLEARLAAKDAEIARLLSYVQHKDECPSMGWNQYQDGRVEDTACTCGLADALAAILKADR